MPKLVQDIAVRLANWHVASGYGLFRSMTGVGSGAMDDLGLPVSMAARPELILEAALLPPEITNGSVSADDLDWRELPFRHKPGNVRSAPTQVVPF